MATWTEADRDNLKAAIASGVLTVEFSGPPSRKVTYQTLKEMRDLLAEMTREVKGTPTHRKIQTTKGFDT